MRGEPSVGGIAVGKLDYVSDANSHSGLSFPGVSFPRDLLEALPNGRARPFDHPVMPPKAPSQDEPPFCWTVMSLSGSTLPTPVAKAVKRFPGCPATKPQTPPLLITAIPIDIVEEILLHLPGQDILKMKRVRWNVGGANT